MYIDKFDFFMLIVARFRPRTLEAMYWPTKFTIPPVETLVF